ncbi:copper transporter [Dictyobacter sp. S3.2.2.5]|uniref:Copper transporter n=1 Tax=Dictyobacter halimunensis TaxID=3026934 RepID=A0ABQ6G139_9CHLR|nr:copper transporter [Dictyobacter sp. S3.2.2.5]
MGTQSQPPSMLAKRAGFIFCIIGCLFFFCMPSQAHAMVAGAQYSHSDPTANAHLASGEPPVAVQVWFTERIEPRFSQVEVYNQQDKRVDRHDSGVGSDGASVRVSLLAGLPDGGYRVVYHNVSQADGHAVMGSFSFEVGGSKAPTSASGPSSQNPGDDNDFDIWEVGVRWLNYLGLAGLVGGLLFWLLIWRPVVDASIEYVGPESRQVRQVMMLRSSSFLFWSWLIVSFGSIAYLFYQASVDSGTMPWAIFANQTLANVAFKSRFGVVWFFRLILLLVAFIIWLAGRRAIHERRYRLNELWGLLLLVSIAIMCTTSLISHAAGRQDLWFMIPSDIVHMLAASFWVGELLMAGFILPLALRQFKPGTADRSRVLLALIPRFSLFTIICIVVLIITGTVEATALLKPFSQLWTSSYGQTLLVKLGLFILLLALGIYHQLRIGSRLSIAGPGQGGRVDAASLSGEKLQRRLQTLLRSEAILGICLLVSVGFLTSLSPAPVVSPPISRAAVYKGTVSGLQYTLTLSPARPGRNFIEVGLKDHYSQPVRTTYTVSVHATMLDIDTGVQDIALQPVKGSPGLYRTTSANFVTAGNWQLTITIHRSGSTDLKNTFIIALGY